VRNVWLCATVKAVGVQHVQHGLFVSLSSFSSKRFVMSIKFLEKYVAKQNKW
jgi:hypothetical protein